VPERPTIRERPRGVELRWTAVGRGNDSGPLLYIVDSRWNIGREESEEEMTAWQQVVQVGARAVYTFYFYLYLFGLMQYDSIQTDRAKGLQQH